MRGSRNTQTTRIPTWLILVTLLGHVTTLSAAMQEAWVLSGDDVGVTSGLGWALDISGDTILAGAPADSGIVAFEGSAFLIDGQTGRVLYQLRPSQPTLQGFFGISLALEANIALIGAPVEGNLPPYEEVYDPGSAYVFDTTTGQQRYRLTPEDSSSLDHFGTGVAISSNLAVVTASGNDFAGEDAGAAYVFDLNTGQQLRRLIPTDAAAGIRFGASVAVEGNLAVIGSLGHDTADLYYGEAYVFDITTGEQLFKLIPPTTYKGVWFGRRISISGGVALVGSPEWQPNEEPGSIGYADVFDITTGQWLRRLDVETSDDIDAFGFHVSLDDDLAAVGAYSHEHEDGRGVVYLFDVNTGELIKQITDDGYTGQLEAFGYSVAREGGLTAVGAYKAISADRNSGVLHIYHDIPEPGVLCIMTVGLVVTCGPGRGLRRLV